MRRICVTGLILLMMGAMSMAQQIGDQTTANYTSARTNLNSDFGPQLPPYTLFSTIALTQTTNASSLLAFTNQGADVVLVGESTDVSTDYRLYNSSTGSLVWTNSFPNASGLPLNYRPAVASDVVILGGPATTTVKGVRVSTGDELWEDKSVAGTSGIHPTNTNGLAIYGGTFGFRAVDPAMGPNPAFWTMAVTTAAEAPVSIYGQQAYVHSTVITDAGSSSFNRLFAVDRSSGAILWFADGALGSDNPSVVASESLVFVNGDQGDVTALDAADGSLVWGTSPAPGEIELSKGNALALAYDRLYVFADADASAEVAATGEPAPMNASISAYDPNTGDLLWSVSEPGEGIRFAVIANNTIYYYHQATNRVRARDAFSGALLWSLNREGVRDMAAVDGSVLLLFPDELQIYRASNILYFAHIADGLGQSTLLAITNVGDETVNATLNFFDPDGAPLSLGVEGFGTTSSVVFSVEPGSSRRLQTLGGEMIQRGWARVVSDGPLSGSSIFQARDMDGLITHEAGVSSARLNGRANLFAEFLLDPDPARTINTALAAANPSDEEATLSFLLIDSGGAEVESSERVLQPGEQIAEFISQIFPGQALIDIHGTVRIRSNIPFVITTLRTQGGYQLSSYAVAQ